MVAYSFKAKFAAMVESGIKRQTVRSARKRHARPGESIQLYAGLRTTSCRKLLPDQTCKAVRPITIDGDQITIEGRLMSRTDAEIFARADGFPDLAEFAAFFRREDGKPFEGVLIEW